MAVVVCLPAARARAQTARCPWLNAATAGGVLGEEAEVELKFKDAPDVSAAEGTCTFHAATAKGERSASLSIQVHTLASAADFAGLVLSCNAPARMPGVGNQAVACVVREGDATVERAIGRVRLRAFEVRWTIPAGSRAAALPDDARAATLQNVAEQIAGSMF